MRILSAANVAFPSSVAARTMLRRTSLFPLPEGEGNIRLKFFYLVRRKSYFERLELIIVLARRTLIFEWLWLPIASNRPPACSVPKHGYTATESHRRRLPPQ